MKAHEVDLRRHPQTGLPNHLNWRPGGAQGAELPQRIVETGESIITASWGHTCGEWIISGDENFDSKGLSGSNRWSWADIWWWIPEDALQCTLPSPPLPAPQEKGTKA